MLKESKEFAARGNGIDLAVGIVIVIGEPSQRENGK